jgi:hypothetical protein
MATESETFAAGDYGHWAKAGTGPIKEHRELDVELRRVYYRQ